MDTNNISTIAMWIASIICPMIAAYGIVIDPTLMTTLIAAIINIIIAVWSSRNPNTFKFLGNQKETIESEREDDGA